MTLKEWAVADLIKTVNSCRYLGGEGHGVGYVRTMSERDEQSILRLAHLIALAEAEEREEPLVRSGKELPRQVSEEEYLRFKSESHGFISTVTI